MSKPKTYTTVLPTRNYYQLSLYARCFRKFGPPINMNRRQKRMMKEPDATKESALFVIFGDALRSLDSVKKRYKFLSLEEIVAALKDEIIPFHFFGSRFNQKRFFKIVNRIVKQSYRECIHFTEVFENYEYDQIQWIDQNHDVKTQKILLKEANIVILENVVKPLIRFYYIFERNGRHRVVSYVPRDKWIKFNSACQDRLFRMGLEVAKNQAILLRGRLKFLPKNENYDDTDFRTIMIGRKTDTLERLKALLKQLVEDLRSSFPQNWEDKDFLGKWQRFDKQMGTRKRKLNVLKLDVRDAFGSVRIEELCEIIRNAPKVLTDSDKTYLIKHVSSQYVRFGCKTKLRRWKRTRGLLQGDILSNILFELYLTHKEKTLLVPLLSGEEDYLIHRKVDDIFFASPNWPKYDEFYYYAKEAYEPISNRKCVEYSIYNHDDPKRANPVISYLGKLINVETMEISNFYDFKPDTAMRTRFKMWNLSKQFPSNKIYEFTMGIMEFSYVNHYFSQYELNSSVNSPERIVRNIFEGMCYVAFKVDAILNSVLYAFSPEQPFHDTVSRILRKKIHQFSCIISSLIKKHKGDKYRFTYLLHDLIRWISLHAFIVVFKKRSLTYSTIIPYLEEKLAKLDRFPLAGAGIKVEFKYFRRLPEPFKNLRLRR